MPLAAGYCILIYCRIGVFDVTFSDYGTRTNFGVLMYRARNHLRDCLEAKGLKRQL